MKIGIDARMMGPQNTRGIGRYVEELSKALVKNYPQDEFVFLAKEKNEIIAKFSNASFRYSEIGWYGFSEQTRLHKILNAMDVDLTHFPHWNVPLFYRKPYVITIHDLLLKHQKNSSKTSTRNIFYRNLKRLGYHLILRNAVKSSLKIFTPTQFVADDLEYFFPDAKEKILVTGEGCNLAIQEVGTMPDYKYLLYVGSAYPHKRLDLLVEAWPDVARLYPDLHLVIAGEKDLFMNRIIKTAQEKNTERVEFLGRVEDSVLVDLYKNAEAFVFPSEFEGFGLPPLEALVLGTPVISSDSRPMEEVLGEKGVIYFKTGSKDDMIEAVKAVVDNSKSLRSKAKIAGIELAAKYDWNRVTEKVFLAYKQVLKDL